MKKFLSIALSIIMALCVMPAGVAFAGGESTINAGETVTVTLEGDGDTYILIFVPQRTSIYRIASHTENFEDPKCDIFDSKGSPVASCDDDANANFVITQEFQKGEEYTIVCGGNGIGDGIEYTVDIIDTTPAVKPSAPQNLKVTDLTETGFKLSWDAVEGAVKYLVFDPTTEPSTAKYVTENYYVFSNLKVETEYTIKVLAVGEGGMNSDSTEITVKTLGEAPAAPTDFKVENITSTGFKLLWNAAANADEYDVYIVSEDSEKFVGTTKDTYYTFSDLTPGQNYSIKVVAKNEYNEASATASARTAPAVPGNLKASNVTQTGFSLDWDDVSSASNYRITVKGNGDTKTIETTESKCSVTGLSANTKYTVTVVAEDEEGLVSDSANIEVTTDKASTGTKPSAPTGYNVYARGNGGKSLYLEWKASSNADGYKVYIVSGSTEYFKGDVQDSKFTFTDLTPSWEYTVKVVAYNDYGTASSTTTVGAAPAAPTGLEAEMSGSTIKATWDVASCHGYYIQWATDESFNNVVGGEFVNGSGSTSYTIKNISSSQTYYVRVRTWKNYEGSKLYSDFTAAEKVGAKPSAPTWYNVYARGNGGKALYLDWNTISNADGYKVYIVSGSTEYFKGDVQDSKFTFTDLTPSWEYTVKVVAYNDYGSSSSTTTVGAAPAAPTGLDVEMSGSTIKATWDVASCHGYYIQWATDESFKNVVGGEFVNGSGSTSYTIKADTTQSYYVRVRTWKNYQGSKLYSDFSAPVKSGAKPSAPTWYNVYARGNGGKALYLDWNTISNADGYKVYIVSGSTEYFKGDVKDSKFTFTDLTPSWEYTVKVVAYNDYGSSSSTTTVGAAPAAPTGLEVEMSGSTIKATWDVASCHGYYIQWATDESFNNVVGGEFVNGSGSTSYTIKNISSSQTYYVRVRTWKNYQGSKLYSDFTAAVEA